MSDLFGEETTKRCSKCGKAKPLSEFPKRTDSRYRSNLRPECKLCNASRQRAYYAKKGAAHWLKYNLKAKYGITFEEYQAMLVAQDGKCAICRSAESAVKGKVRLSANLSVDHSHAPGGKIRGLLCNRCNRAIGLLKDDHLIAQAAANYLLLHSKDVT